VRCAQALSMPEGRAEPRGRSTAKSMDGAEHSAMLKDVMAGVYVPGQNLVQIRRVTRFRPMS
jgi:hypothetical protein